MITNPPTSADRLRVPVRCAELGLLIGLLAACGPNLPISPSPTGTLSPTPVDAAGLVVLMSGAGTARLALVGPGNQVTSIPVAGDATWLSASATGTLLITTETGALQTGTITNDAPAWSPLTPVANDLHRPLQFGALSPDGR